MTPTGQPPLNARQAEWRYIVLSGLQWLPIGLVAPILVLQLRARGIELPVIGALFAVYTLVVIVLELPTGSFADVLGRRRTLVLSRILNIASLLGMAVATDVVQFGVVMALGGIARALQSGPLEAWYVDSVRAADPEADVRRGISRGWSAEAAALATGAVVGGLLPSLADGLPADGLLIPLSVPYLAAAALQSLGLIAVLVPDDRTAERRACAHPPDRARRAVNGRQRPPPRRRRSHDPAGARGDCRLRICPVRARDRGAGPVRDPARR